MERIDLFRKVHKGLRKAIMDFAYKAGTTNYQNSEEIAELKSQGKEVFHFLKEHASNEERFFLPHVKSKALVETERIQSEHVEIEKSLSMLEAKLENLSSHHTHPVAGSGYEFYLIICDFIAVYLKHMQVEENELTITVYEKFSDEELIPMFQETIKNTSPSDMMMMLKYMLPAMDSGERCIMLAGIKANAPKDAYEAVIGLAKRSLSVSEWEQLENAL